ncbi:ABC transporter permease [Yoonia sp. F2084L]|uniref:ABC transporter permease n=1 Tax=Yoonia sp. F2084L TaxID=2926419 RepID=UPI001FF45DAE|nr:ABC transporter permease [Yoonia sp. F2084L]MCK0096622.1 ABC transporter permease [Yoonia sp. F2084L]
MTETPKDEDCVSKKPWSEVLSRSLKLFTFNAAKEGGKSFGRIIFFVMLAIIALMVVTYVVDSFTGWFSSWFDFWPFNSAPNPVEEPEKSKGWWPWGRDAEVEVEASGSEDEVKWYCRLNPLC